MYCAIPRRNERIKSSGSYSPVRTDRKLLLQPATIIPARILPLSRTFPQKGQSLNAITIRLIAGSCGAGSFEISNYNVNPRSVHRQIRIGVPRDFFGLVSRVIAVIIFEKQSFKEGRENCERLNCRRRRRLHFTTEIDYTFLLTRDDPSFNLECLLRQLPQRVVPGQ